MITPDLDALIERQPWFPPADERTEWANQAAAAITELREENALMGHPPAQIQKLERRAERAEAELDTQNRALAQCRALLKQEMDDVLPLRVKVAALEAERDAAFALLRVCKDSVHPDTKIVIEALTT